MKHWDGLKAAQGKVESESVGKVGAILNKWCINGNVLMWWG